MFLVARRTKYRVVERVDVDNTPPLPLTPSNHDKENTRDCDVPPSSQTTVYPNSSLPSQPTSVIQMPPPSHPTPSEQASAVPVQSFPNVSLASYLRMAQGTSSNPAPSPSATTSWAQQLNHHGVLQITHGPNRQPNFHQNNRPYLFQGDTSTPLDPTEVPVEELNVYWEDSCKHCLIVSIITKTG